MSARRWRGLLGLAALAALAWPRGAAAGAWSTRTVSQLATRVYTPTAGGRFESGRGLLLALHGCTQTNAQLQSGANLESAAEAWGLVIAVPQVNGGQFAGCWDYYGPSHTRSGRDSGPLLALVANLLADRSLGVDAAQVYVAGLSSGGGQALVLGCLAPDVFAGVAAAAGPAVGTTAAQIATVATDIGAATALCQRLANAQSAHFSTQLASMIFGSNDFVVNKGYNALNAEMFAGLYGAETSGSFDVAALEGHMPMGTGRVWSDAEGPRSSLIEVQGMGHAWPAGSGAAGEVSFIAGRGPAWASYLGRFFTENNRRVTGRPEPPRDGGVAPIDAGPGDAGAEVDSGSSADAQVAQDGGPEVGADGGGRGGVDEGEARGGCVCAGAGRAAGGWWLAALLVAALPRSRRR